MAGGGKGDGTAEKFNQFVGLRDSVIAAADKLPEAETGIQGLAALRSEVLSASEQIAAARVNAEQLTQLNGTLSTQAEQIAAARQNLQSLLSIQQQLAAATEQVTAAVQNLEILSEFQDEAQLHIRSLEALRRTLLEIAMMETTIGRVARTIEPLTQIGNLRRLGDEEVREAARVILDRRNARYSQADASSAASVVSDGVPADAAATSGDADAEAAVPMPRDAAEPQP